MSRTVPVPGNWIEFLRSQGETGIDCIVARVTLHDGRSFEQVAIRDGYITMVRGHKEVPFSESDIKEVEANHKKWNFSEDKI
jgi:endonuclease YncB( thermonuclease family)